MFFGGAIGAGKSWWHKRMADHYRGMLTEDTLDEWCQSKWEEVTPRPYKSTEFECITIDETHIIDASRIDRGIAHSGTLSEELWYNWLKQHNTQHNEQSWIKRAFGRLGKAYTRLTSKATPYYST